MTDVAVALGYKSAQRAGHSMNLVEGVDKGSERIATPGGPQGINVLTWTGLTKFLMRSNMEVALRFQDDLARMSSDLTFHGIAFRDEATALAHRQNSGHGMLEQFASVVTEQLTKLTAITLRNQEQTQQLVAVVAQLQEQSQKATGRFIHAGKDGKIEDLHLWSETEMVRVRKRGYLTTREWLEVNEPKSEMRASALAQRAINYARRNQNRTGVIRYLRGRTTKVTVIHRDILWSAFRLAEGKTADGRGGQLLLLPGRSS